MTSLTAAQAIQADILPGAATNQAMALPACPHPFLTPAESFDIVAMGNPKPYTLNDKALADARMTPETWHLEKTADSRVESPHVTQPAGIQTPRRLKDGAGLDFDTLRELGESNGVEFIKATQCLKITKASLPAGLPTQREAYHAPARWTCAHDHSMGPWLMRRGSALAIDNKRLNS